MAQVFRGSLGFIRSAPPLRHCVCIVFTHFIVWEVVQIEDVCRDVSADVVESHPAGYSTPSTSSCFCLITRNFTPFLRNKNCQMGDNTRETKKVRVLQRALLLFRLFCQFCGVVAPPLPQQETVTSESTFSICMTCLLSCVFPCTRDHARPCFSCLVCFHVHVIT